MKKEMIIKRMNKRGGMELSMGTIVILVIAMSMLILGLVLVKNIFSTASGAINSIDSSVKSKIAEMFSDESKSIAVYPTERKISLKQGSKLNGFAFSLRNKKLSSCKFSYEVGVDTETTDDLKKKCAGLKEATANSWIDNRKGTINLGGSSVEENPELITFTVPDDAPTCTIKYSINVNNGAGCDETGFYTGASVIVTIAPK